ncbi:MAG: right-handed parallel beta-helix repeat-containing protein, partial [Bacteroidales bacterium]|nr:right-handed parallel beta-helix repeat-containing protein [Bacteroidales bacterium]
LMILSIGCSNEYHVVVNGDDSNKGSRSSPLKTISAAAKIAQPGDIITVHQGVYRERINPPRGGSSDNKRIVYQTVPNEEVIIKGSEIIKAWKKKENDTWMVIIPNSFFKDFNPYNDLINGDWFNPLGREHHTGAVYLNGNWLTEAVNLEETLKPVDETIDTRLWFAQVDSFNTTISAQFKNVNPNESLVEINVRQTIFYPEKTGVNYITVRGFKMMHAATPWAPPTAEQIGLIGTNWSKGWIIENNDISYSVCTGITLGKYGDEYDNTSQNSAGGYVKTIERALDKGWSKDKIGHHLVSNNHISHCEQAGIVASMGPVFCKVTGNTIHDIHVRHLFTGAEMAGIKFHGAVDTEISDNHIFNTNRGIWLDWMTQGTRISRNLLHDNGPGEDLFVEVNHGPFMVDNNILLSKNSLLVNSQGGAYVHNLIAGRVHVITGERRQTPYLKAHSTELVGLAPNNSGDERFYNNIFINGGLQEYDQVKLPVFMAGNVFLKDAKPSKYESSPLVKPEVDPDVVLVEKNDGLYIQISFDKSLTQQQNQVVTTALLGKAKIPNLPYELANGSPFLIDTDYLGQKRDKTNPCVGPLEYTGTGKLSFKLK